MSTIVTRVGKGSPLTWTEVDSNFTNLNTDKLQSGDTAASLTITSATINGGTITGITDLVVADGGTGLSSLTAGYIPFGAGTSAFGSSANLFWDSANNFLGVGTSSPVNTLDVYKATAFELSIRGDAGTTLSANRYSTNNVAANITMRKARGTAASPTAVASGDQLGALNFVAYGGTNNRNIANIFGTVDTYTSDTDISSYLRFTTTPSGSITAVERMRIDSAGNVGIGITNPTSLLDVRQSNPTRGIIASVVNTATSSQTGAQIRITQGGIEDWVIGQPAAVNAFAIWSGRSSGVDGTERMRIDSSGNVGIGTTSPNYGGWGKSLSGFVSSGGFAFEVSSSNTVSDSNIGALDFIQTSNTVNKEVAQISAFSIGSTSGNTGGYLRFWTKPDAGSITERMRIDSSGQVIVGKTVNTFGTQGAVLNAENAFYNTFTRSGGSVISVNRTTNDGTLMEFAQDGTVEGTISVSGTTVSYNGGHLSRWSQLYNETTKVAVYRGSVLESVDAMCEWEKDGQPLPNEQATKTIVSTTVASKAVAGVFDRYDEDDKNNPYDFYVAQSGDFVIRIAQDVTVQNGDLLESAGDGTARPQADDICRSSTIAKVTSNYVSATYEDGSYCVPCILMIG